MSCDARPLLKRLKDRLADLSRHTGPGVLDDDEPTPGTRLDPHPHRRARPGVRSRVGEQVLHDPLDFGGVDRDQHGRGLQADGMLAEQLRSRLFDDPADQLTVIDPLAVGVEGASGKATVSRSVAACSRARLSRRSRSACRRSLTSRPISSSPVGCPCRSGRAETVSSYVRPAMIASSLGWSPKVEAPRRREIAVAHPGTSCSSGCPTAWPTGWPMSRSAARLAFTTRPYGSSTTTASCMI